MNNWCICWFFYTHCSVLFVTLYCCVLFQALEKHKITLVWDQSVLAVIANAYNVHLGISSIKNAVLRQVVRKLSAAQTGGSIRKSSTVRVGGTSNGAAVRLGVILKGDMDYSDIEEEKDLK